MGRGRKNRPTATKSRNIITNMAKPVPAGTIMNTGTDMTDTRMMSTSIMGTDITMSTVRAAPAGIIMNMTGIRMMSTSIMNMGTTMSMVKPVPAGIIMNMTGIRMMSTSIMNTGTTTSTVFCRRHAPLLIPKLRASFT